MQGYTFQFSPFARLFEKGGHGMNTFIFVATVIGLIASIITIEDKIERLYEKHHTNQENRK